MAGAVISRALGLAGSFLAARILGEKGFGQFATIQSTVGVFATFASFGLGLTAAKSVAEFRRTDPQKALRIAALASSFSCCAGLIMAFVIWLLSDWLAKTTLAAPALGYPLRISSLALVATAIVGAQTGILSGLERFRSIAWLNVLAGLTTLGCVTLGSYYLGASGAVWGWSLSLLISVFPNAFCIANAFHGQPLTIIICSCHSEWRILRSFSFPAVLGSTILSPVAWLGNALLVHSPSGFSEMGLFTAANQWRAAILFVPATVGIAMFPIMSNLSGENDQRMSKMILYQAVGAGICGIAVAAPVMLLSGHIMRAYGSGFRLGSHILVITSLSAAIVAMNNQISRIVASMGRMWLSCSFDVVSALTLLCAILLLVHQSGAKGLAYSFLIAALCQAVVQLVYLTKIVRSLGNSACPSGV